MNQVGRTSMTSGLFAHVIVITFLTDMAPWHHRFGVAHVESGRGRDKKFFAFAIAADNGRVFGGEVCRVLSSRMH
jgi:hypothetical protein